VLQDKDEKHQLDHRLRNEIFHTVKKNPIHSKTKGS